MESVSEYRKRCAAEKGKEYVPFKNKWKSMYVYQEKDGGPKCHDCPYKCEKCKELLRYDDRHLITDSLCWCCDKACKSGCSWMRKKEPVEGWEAKKYVKNSCGEKIETYRVFKCPEFVRG